MNKTLEILGTPLNEIEIGATGLREIAQNVKTIMTTWRGSVFLDRAFGIDTSMIDKPINTLLPDLIMDLTSLIQRYEPRVSVVGITLQKSDVHGGEIFPLVQIQIKDGALL